MKKTLPKAKKVPVYAEQFQYEFKPFTQVNFEKLLEEAFDSYFNELRAERSAQRPNTQAWFFILGQILATNELLGHVMKRLKNLSQK